MKKTLILYWVITGIFAAYMAFTAVPNVLKDPGSVEFITKNLGYPEYFVQFIGIAKILGVIGILIPGFPRIKEWAYAGLAFDLIGATYSIIALYGVDITIIFMILPIIFLFTSYVLHHKTLGMKNQEPAVLKPVTA